LPRSACSPSSGDVHDAAQTSCHSLSRRTSHRHWFTASTSFANPAVTFARGLTDTFAGIRPLDIPGFIVAQFAGAAVSTLLFRWLVPALPQTAEHVVMGRSETSPS
jgi:glycerol uptake facilitator-like aquaporin